MPINWGSEPQLAGAYDAFPLLGFDTRLLTDGRIYVNEWVLDETAGRIQVHDDLGRDYIEAGNPTLGMLYASLDDFMQLEEETLLQRIRDNLATALRNGKGGK